MHKRSPDKRGDLIVGRCETVIQKIAVPSHGQRSDRGLKPLGNVTVDRPFGSLSSLVVAQALIGRPHIEQLGLEVGSGKVDIETVDRGCGNFQLRAVEAAIVVRNYPCDAAEVVALEVPVIIVESARIYAQFAIQQIELHPAFIGPEVLILVACIRDEIGIACAKGIGATICVKESLIGKGVQVGVVSAGLHTARNRQVNQRVIVGFVIQSDLAAPQVVVHARRRTNDGISFAVVVDDIRWRGARSKGVAECLREKGLLLVCIAQATGELEPVVEFIFHLTKHSKALGGLPDVVEKLDSKSRDREQLRLGLLGIQIVDASGIVQWASITVNAQFLRKLI